MNEIVARIGAQEEALRTLRDRAAARSTQSRARILLALVALRSVTKVARTLRHARSCIHKVIASFLAGGVAALEDRRLAGRARIPRKEEVVKLLPVLVAKQPTDLGWRRTTWTIELVAKEVARQLKVFVSRSQMGRLLRGAGCRLVKPKQTIRLAPPDRAEKMAELRELLAKLPPEDVVLFSDEVDIHLNPKIGRDWTPSGIRKEVVTPGQNKKWYFAGAFCPKTGNLITVDGERKTSALFISLLDELVRRYRSAGKVHLVVDNYIIHKSKITEKAVEKLKGKVVLHFLPPYSPDYNPIERVWLDLHSTVTRNHRCLTIGALVEEVKSFVTGYARRGGRLVGLDRHAPREATAPT